LGFTLVFVSLGTAAGYLGSTLAFIRVWLSRVGGIVVIIFGINMIGLIRIPFLQYDLRVHTPLKKTTGFLQSFLMGVFFSAGWTPCVGPVLGAILTLALNGGSIGKGALLLTVYSIGLGVPFLIAALGVGWVTQLLKRYAKALRIIEIAMGIVLVVVGIMLFMGTFNELARFGIFIDFGI
jgi:cytochrome c-type biogenesis protein